MRPVLINGRFTTGHPAATYTVARHLSQALAARSSLNGAQITLALPPKANGADTGLPVEYIGHLGGNLWEQLSLPRGLRGRVVLNFAARSPLFVRRAFTMVHDAQVFTMPRSYSWAFRTTLRANIRLAGRFQLGLLTVSEFAKGELVALGIAPPERIHVIPNGVDHVLRVTQEDGVLNTHGLTPRRFALALANTQPHKNIAVLLRAFARPELADLTLVLTGRATAKDFAASGHTVPPNVTFAGYVSDGEMRSLQANALAVCTPSLTEGFGMPPVEAMLLGTPAVIAPCGALPEVCGPGALHADPHNPEAWAAALRHLHTKPDARQTLADAGQSWAKRFTWDAAAERLETVLAQRDAPRP